MDSIKNLSKEYGVNPSWDYWFGGQFWVGWWYGPASTSFFTDICGLDLGKDMMERAEAYRKVCESVNYFWPNRHFVMVCERPKKILRDERGRLHCTDGKAIEYPDGWGLHMLHGVRFPEDLYLKVTSGKMPFEDILKIEDIDQRTQAMRFGDVDEFVEHAKGVLLDRTFKKRKDGTHIRYALYRFPAGDIFTKDAYYVVYDDLVPGTKKRYMSGVEESKTVAEAMAWKFSDAWHTTRPEEWLVMVPGEQMN